MSVVLIAIFALKSPQLQLVKAPCGPNGIVPRSVDVYNDVSLRTKLKNLSTQIGNFLNVNPTTVQNGLFQIQGAEKTSTQSTFSIATNPIPSVSDVLTTTLNNTGATTSTVTGTTPSVTTTAPTTSGSTSNAVTTTPATVSPIPTLSLSNTDLSSPGPQLDAISRLQQYTEFYSEATSLQTVLERATSQIIDLQTGVSRIPVVIGIPININPTPRDRGLVAEVKVKVEDIYALKDQGNAVQITTVIPEKRTYNFTKATSSMSQVGLGVVFSVLNVGGASGRASDRIYMAKDFDTIAMSYPNEGADADKTVQFGWRYKPVFNETSVSPGLREALVGLSLAPSEEEKLLRVTVTTSWHRTKCGLVEPEIIDSNEYRAEVPVDDRKVSPVLDNAVMAPNSAGTVDVTLSGHAFFDGMDLLVGNQIVKPDYNAASKTLKFKMTSDDLLNTPVSYVSLFGNSKLIAKKDVMFMNDLSFLKAIAKENPKNQDSTDLELIFPGKHEIELKDRSVTPIVGVGGKIYGLGSADLEIGFDGLDTRIKVKVPTKALLANPTATFSLPFHRFDPTFDPVHVTVPVSFRDNPGFDISTATPSSEVTVGKGTKCVIYTLIGRGLRNVQMVIPGTTTPVIIPSSDKPAYDDLVRQLAYNATDSVALIPIPSDFLAKVSKVVLLKRTDSDYLRSIPIDTLAKPTPPAITGVKVADINQHFSGAAPIQGENLKRITKVTCGDLTLAIFSGTVPAGKEPQWFIQIPQSLTKELGPRSLTLTLDDGSAIVVSFNIIANPTLAPKPPVKPTTAG